MNESRKIKKIPQDSSIWHRTFYTYCFIKFVRTHTLFCLLLCVILRKPSFHIFSFDTSSYHRRRNCGQNANNTCTNKPNTKSQHAIQQQIKIENKKKEQNTKIILIYYKWRKKWHSEIYFTKRISCVKSRINQNLNMP